MSIIGKVLPKYYKYLKMSGLQSFITKPKAISKTAVKTLKFDTITFKSAEHSSDEIKKAYRAYAQSPYVNDYLRKGEVVSEQSNEIISCLTQGINQSEPTTGTFLRGIVGTRKKPINNNTIAEYIFNNKGFTSTTKDKSFASSFACSCSKNSAMLEFEITKPMKAYTADKWETIFAPNAFTADKFKINKISDNYYKIIQR
jgi:hypothetical protein